MIKLLLEEQVPCVTVTGDHGSGKTEMVAQACEYVRERHHFDSFLWADVRKAVARAEGGQNGPSSHFAFASPALSCALGLPGSGDAILDPCRLVKDEAVQRRGWAASLPG